MGTQPPYIKIRHALCSRNKIALVRELSSYFSIGISSNEVCRNKSMPYLESVYTYVAELNFKHLALKHASSGSQIWGRK